MAGVGAHILLRLLQKQQLYIFYQPAVVVDTQHKQPEKDEESKN
jgi:hypothetical protein